VPDHEEQEAAVVPDVKVYAVPRRQRGKPTQLAVIARECIGQIVQLVRIPSTLRLPAISWAPAR
jgi:hypothetical protein